jgi:hypothetical protein
MLYMRRSEVWSWRLGVGGGGVKGARLMVDEWEREWWLEKME